MPHATTAAILAVALLTLLLTSLPAAAVDLPEALEAGPYCSGGRDAVAGWSPVDQFPVTTLASDDATSQSVLPLLLNATLAELLERRWESNSTTDVAPVWISCGQQELEVSLTGCSRMSRLQRTQDDEQVQELVLWANIFCPGFYRDTPSFQVSISLPLPLPLEPGGLTEDLVDAMEMHVKVLFSDVQVSGGSDGAATALPTGSSSDDGQVARVDAAPPIARTTPLPPGPDWARGPEFCGGSGWGDYSVKQWGEDVDVLAAANASGTQYDFVLYGDSLTKHLARGEGLKLWESFFSEDNGWGPTAPLGVVGNEVADLMWRLVDGGEVPAIDPKVVAVFVGINDLLASYPLEQTTQRMGFLLDWLAAVLPRSKLVLLALLPNALEDTAPLNERYAWVAAERGIKFLSCAHDIDPNDPSMLYDGTHATPAAQTVLLKCLAPAIQTMRSTA